MANFLRTLALSFGFVGLVAGCSPNESKETVNAAISFSPEALQKLREAMGVNLMGLFDSNGSNLFMLSGVGVGPGSNYCYAIYASQSGFNSCRLSEGDSSSIQFLSASATSQVLGSKTIELSVRPGQKIFQLLGMSPAAQSAFSGTSISQPQCPLDEGVSFHEFMNMIASNSEYQSALSGMQIAEYGRASALIQSGRPTEVELNLNTNSVSEAGSYVCASGTGAGSGSGGGGSSEPLPTHLVKTYENLVETAALGESVSISASGDMLAMGAPLSFLNRTNNSGSPLRTGYAVLFARTAGVWENDFRRRYGGNQQDDRAGRRVALSPDGTMIAYQRVINDSTGQVYYSRGAAGTGTDPNSWSSAKQVDWGGNAANNDLHGSSISLDSSGTNALIGATGSGGRLEWCVGSDGCWDGNFGSLFSTQSPGTELGFASAMSGDGTIAAVGKPGANANVGGVTLINRGTGAWNSSTLTDLTLSDTSNTQRFGEALSMNSDGTLLAVGAPATNTSRGKVWIYVSSASGVWVSVEVPAPEPLNPGAGFGTSVAISGDGTRLVVGAPGQGIRGKAWVYSVSSGHSAELVTPSTVSNARVGASVAINGNGSVVVVGAPTSVPVTADGPTTVSGAVYIFGP